MMDALAYGVLPRVFALFVLITVGLFVVFGYFAEAKWPERVRHDASFSTIQAAIFAAMAFLLGFMFTIAAQHFDERRILLRDEANSLGTTYLRASFLPAQTAKTFRNVLLQYAQARLAAYTSPDEITRYVNPPQAKALGDRLWEMASKAGRSDPRNVQLGWLVASLNETLDLGNSQSVALVTHIPGPVFGLAMLLMYAAAFAIGLGFARAKAVDWPLSIAYLVLISALIFTIDDLDRPQRGLIHVDVSMLQSTIRDMQLTR